VNTKDASVKISNLVKTYTEHRGRPTFTAVRNIDLEIKGRRIHGLG
jgi:ABC-type oligopeptide transport system ATPase subunit